MLERAWLVLILLFVGGWAIVAMWDGSIVGGGLVYVSSAGLLGLLLVALARFALRLVMR